MPRSWSLVMEVFISSAVTDRSLSLPLRKLRMHCNLESRERHAQPSNWLRDEPEFASIAICLSFNVSLAIFIQPIDILSI